jgi:hypothetical protein
MSQTMHPMQTMKKSSKRFQIITVFCLLAAALLAATAAMAAPGDRYLHVKVDDADKGESVNINLPLSIAEKILPTVNKGHLHGGTVSISDADIEGVDIKAILDAIRTAPDNEFITVKEKDQDVRVAKSNGNLLIHVRDNSDGKDKRGQKVEITVPMKVVDALFSTAKQNELDISAAIRALDGAGEMLLVSVEDASQHVKIWVDSRSSTD